jgi:hypothetical protein
MKSIVGPWTGDGLFLNEPKTLLGKKPKSNISAKSELLKS